MSAERPMDFRVGGEPQGAYPAYPDGMLGGVTGTSEQAPTNDIGGFLQALWRRKLLVAAVIVLSLLMGLLVIKSVTPRFSATSKVLVDAQKVQELNFAGLRVPLRSGGTGSLIAERARITSREFIAGMIDRLQLYNDNEFTTTLTKNSEVGLVSRLTRQLLGLLGLTFEQDLPPPGEAGVTQAKQAAITGVGTRLTVNFDPRTDTLDIQFQSRQADKAAMIANAFADIYVQERFKGRLDQVRQTAQLLKEQLSSTQRELTDSEKKIEDFRRSSGLIGGRNSTALSQQLAQLKAQLIVAQTASAEAETRANQAQNAVRSGSADDFQQMLSNGIVLGLRQNIGDLERQQEELSERYGERHPEIVAIKQKLADLNSRLNGEMRKVAEILQNEASLARARENTLQQNINALEAQVTSFSDAEFGIKDMQQDVDQLRQRYNVTLDQLQEVESFIFKQADPNARGNVLADAQVIELARIPTSPFFPNKLLIVLFALIIGMIAGMVVVAVLEMIDTSIRTPEQLERLTGLPTVGLVPMLQDRGPDFSPVEEVLNAPTSSYAEAINGIWLQLDMQRVNGRAIAVCITSSQPYEGKSVLAISLARSAARAGKRAILIDGDLRRPSVHRYLNINNRFSLASYLTGKARIEECIVVDEASGLHVVPGAVAQGNPADILNSRSLTKLLSALRQIYDLVIIDSPPLLAVADGRILIRAVDSTLFVTRWGVTRRDTVAAAIRPLQSLTSGVAGVVLTQIDMRKYVRYKYDLAYSQSRYVDSNPA
jgi:polysaccharide biosynthesis transport protein